MGRRWAWPDDTTPDAVPPEHITCWLWTSAGVTTDRAQHWLEPYTQRLESGQWHSRTALEACAQAVAKPAQPRKATPGGGTGAAVPGPSTTHSSTAPALGAVVFRQCPIWASEVLPKMTMSSWKMLQRCLRHRRYTIPCRCLQHRQYIYATATVPQALSVNATTTVPQASLVNAATTVLEASSAYDTAPVPLALPVSTTTMVPQALLVTTAATVPQASSVNVGATVPLASSATALTSMDVDAPHTPVDDTTEAEEQAMAEIYA